MPTPIKPTGRAGFVPARPTGVVKFSDKLTDSLRDITGMIDEHKSMIDSIQEVP